MDTSSTVARTNVMGQLRSVVQKHGRKKLSGYKKRFWVVNFHTKRLEVYKNDQSHEPANQWGAEDIRGVIYAGDKQNKFYAMIVQTRLRQTIKFRINSLEERDRWSHAITQLIDAVSMSHRRNNILAFLQRRTRAVGRSLDVNIAVDWPRLLTAPQEMLEYTVEAVDSALASVTLLVREYGSELPVPRNYTLNVQTLEGTVPAQEDFPGPQYDPMKKSAVLNVVLYKDGLDHVKFCATGAEEVIHIMQSDVFRNPLIEGWIDTSPGCAETCDEIRAVLGFKASEFPITFQWGQHMSDSDRVETYLQEFVNEGFFRGILSTLKETLRDVEKMPEDVLRPPVSALSSPSPTPRNANSTHLAATTSSPEKSHNPQQQQPYTGGTNIGGMHSRSFSATLFLPSLDLAGLSPAGGSGSHGSQPTTARGQQRLLLQQQQQQQRERAAAAGTGSTAGVDSASGHPLSAAVMNEVQETAVRLLSENITGLAIQLDKRTVDEGKRAPAVVVEHTIEYESRSRPAFLLVAKYGQVYEQHQPSRETAPLHAQLFEVAFHALLSKQISSLRNRLNDVFDGKVKVAIMWDRLLQVLRKLDATLFLRDLPKLVNALADVYLARMLHTMELMNSVRASTPVMAPSASSRRHGNAANATGAAAAAAAESHYGAGEPFTSPGGGAPMAPMNGMDPLPEESELTLFDVFTHCVGGIVIDFFSFPDLIERHGGNPHKPTAAVAAAALPEPTVVNGTLTDAVLCADDSTVSAMVHTVNQLREAGYRRAPMLVRNIFAYAATPRMGVWCEKFFSSPDRVAACTAAPRRVIEDEFASDSDVGTAEPGLDLGDGEAVANERRAEISVLNLKRVVNTVYDSQGNSIDLKISAQEIHTAIRSLQKAFRPKKVTNHDVMRVLTVNLRRLRSMYSLAADGETNSFLSHATTMQLLRDFCEFKDTEDYIAGALRRYAAEPFRAHGAPYPANDSLNSVAEENGNEPDGDDDDDDADPPRASTSTATVPPVREDRSNSNANSVEPAAAASRDSAQDHRPASSPHHDHKLPSSRRSSGVVTPPVATVPPTRSPDHAGSDAVDMPLNVEVSNHGSTNPPSSSSSSTLAVSDSSATPTSSRAAFRLITPIGGSRAATSTDPVKERGESSGSPSRRASDGRQRQRRASGRNGSATERFEQTVGPYSDCGDGGEDSRWLYDFQAFSSVALNELLPREAVLARRAWRTGFVFGLENAGKSHVVNSIRGFPRTTVATVGLSRQVVAFDEWVLSLNELGGRDSFRTNWRFYAKRMEKVHFLLHVVDCSSTRTYRESLKYLKEVVAHFKEEPLVIVFNNYQASPRPKDKETMAYEYEVDVIEKMNPKRPIFTCTHELSLVHPIPKATPMPTLLRTTMRELADVLFQSTPDEEKPTAPKEAGRETQPHGGGASHSTQTSGAPVPSGDTRGNNAMNPRRDLPDRQDSWRDASSFYYDYDSTLVENTSGNRRGGGSGGSGGQENHPPHHSPY